MLTAIRVGNFKAFAESQRIPLRPLTFIYGANSSGKSSILHSLILARHAQEMGDLDVHQTNVGGESVDLGGFRQFIHCRDVSRRMEWSAELDTGTFNGRMAELLAAEKQLTITLTVGIAVDDQGRPTQSAIPEIHSYELLADNRSLARMSKRPDGKLQLDRINHEHPIFQESVKAFVKSSATTESLEPSDYEGLDNDISAIVPKLIASAGRFLPEGLAKSDVFTPGAQTALFLVSRGRRKEDLAAVFRYVIPRTLDELIRESSRAIYAELTRLRYLGPLRSYPPRNLGFSKQHDPNWQAGGGYTWDVLRKDAEVRAKVNHWLSAGERLQTHYQIAILSFLPLDRVTESIESTFDQYESILIDKSFSSEVYENGKPIGEHAEVTPLELVTSKKLNQLAEKGIREGIFLDAVEDLSMIDMRTKTKVTHRDIGIGISQVLPVLVAAYASRNQIIAIEQPEIHLHPALQADLGDVFIESALGAGNNRFLIETHSEHLLLRVMRRMRETSNENLPEGALPVTPNDVCLLFIQQPEGTTSSAVRHLELDEEGQLLDAWPGGFFEEGYRERFA